MSDIKHEGLYIAIAIIGGLGVGLINSKPASIGFETDPFYGGLGVGISIGGIGYLISKKAFKASTKSSLIVGGVILALSFYKFNPKLSLPINRKDVVPPNQTKPISNK
jgi:hypothetical protein